MGGTYPDVAKGRIACFLFGFQQAPNALRQRVKQLSKAEQEALRDWLENMRVIYRFDPARGEIYLVVIDNHREIYRD